MTIRPTNLIIAVAGDAGWTQPMRHPAAAPGESATVTPAAPPPCPMGAATSTVGHQPALGRPKAWSGRDGQPGSMGGAALRRGRRLGNGPKRGEWLPNSSVEDLRIGSVPR